MRLCIPRHGEPGIAMSALCVAWRTKHTVQTTPLREEVLTIALETEDNDMVRRWKLRGANADDAIARPRGLGCVTELEPPPASERALCMHVCKHAKVRCV